jgi:tetratricopeptide (TPR) repeat protein
LILAEGTLNYHEIILTRRPNGVRAVDMFVYTSGERLSETGQRALLLALPRDNQTLLASLSGKARASVRRFALLPDITELFHRGEYPRVLALYSSLPPDVRGDKAFKLIRVMAAQKVNEAEYMMAIDDYRRAFPNDPSTYLISVDAHILAGRFAEVHEALNRLDQQVGGDLYLQTLRAQAFLQEGKLPQAEQIAEKMLAENPRSVSAHWMLVFSSILSKRFETTVYLLGKLQDELGVPIGDLSLAPGYAEFAASPAFANWQASIRR